MRIPYILKACYVFSLLIWLLSIRVFAQSDAPISQFATGNADAMSIFGQYPQISYTGVPNINIPIYNFTYEGLSLPVTLSYNNNLVKPYNTGSWVGLGWDITAGGVINRTVNGKPDDCNWYGHRDDSLTHDTQMGYYYNHSYLSSSNWTDSLTILKAFDDLHYTFSHTGSDSVTTPTIRDYCPDTFTFSIGDMSGSFYLDDQGKWKVKSKNKVKVVIDNDNDFTTVAEASPIDNHSYLSRITLIDNRGISYVFGGPNAYEEVKNDPKDTLDIFAKSWYIKTITFPNGKQITFDYIKGPFVNVSQPGFFDGVRIVAINQRNHPVYLTAIHSDLADISFISSQRASHYSELDSIKISSKSSIDPLRKFAFAYTSTKTGSFKLTDLTQLDKNNHVGAHYGFGYDTEIFDSLSIHPNTDHWGYYNTKGAVTRYASVWPSAQTGFDWDEYTEYRDRNDFHAKAEMLERITYPTGGYTTYAWEPNEASSFIYYDNKLCFFADSGLRYYFLQPGGVRIKQITNYDNTNAKIGSKNFYYLNNFTPYDITHHPLDTARSSGILHTLPPQLYFQLAPVAFSIFPVNSILDGESHVTYSEVAEVNNDGSYTVTKYTNSDNGYGNVMYEKFVHDNLAAVNHHYILPTYSSNVQERGAPLNVRTYSNTGALLSARGYEYTTVVNNLQFVKAYDLEPEAYGVAPYKGSNNYFNSYRGSAIKIFTNNFYPLSIKDTLYNNTSYPLVKTTTMTYDTASANLTKVRVTYNSKRQTEETDYLYPPDMVSGSHDPNGVYAAMTAANYISPVIETIHKLNGTQLSLSKTDYKSYMPLGYYSFFVPDSSLVQYGTNAAKTTEKYSSYDGYGHLGTDLKNGLFPTAYLYGYNNNLLIAKVVNAQQEEVMFEDFEQSTAANAIVAGAAHSGTHYYLGDYIPNFVVPDGRAYVISFWYHSSGNTWKYKEQPYVRFQTILPTGANAVDDILIYPADAQATTYSYNTLAGVTSITDSRGNAVSYEYDDLQRLVNIKDQDGNIKTHYCYNYAGQETDCTVAGVDSLPAPITATGIYVRTEITNLNTEYFDSDDTEQSYITSGDVCIKFYADPEATIPLTLDHDVTVTLDESVQTTYDGTLTDNDQEYGTYTAHAGDSSYCLGTMDLYYIYEYLDGMGNLVHYTDNTYNYSVLAGSPYYTKLPDVQF
jgi:YD repeat-containing protein